MIQIPRNHLADETLARIAVAAKRTRRGGELEQPKLAPEDAELVDLPASLMPAKPAQTSGGPQDGGLDRAGSAAPTAEPAPPPLNETGLNMGLVLHGADSFDAMLET